MATVSRLLPCAAWHGCYCSVLEQEAYQSCWLVHRRGEYAASALLNTVAFETFVWCMLYALAGRASNHFYVCVVRVQVAGRADDSVQYVLIRQLQH